MLNRLWAVRSSIRMSERAEYTPFRTGVNGDKLVTDSEGRFSAYHKRPHYKMKDGKLLLEDGFISLQSESHPCEFRKVELLVLDK